jgi:hypothetical protein
MPDIICTHYRGQYTSGCEYCNPPPYTAGLTTYPGPSNVIYGNGQGLPDPGEPPLTFDEIRKLRALLAKAEPLKYKGVEIVWGLT